MIPIKNEEEIELMRISSEIVAKALEHSWSFIKPGVSTGKLDEEIEKFILARNARPSFKGLYGFPASACTSINHEVVHGIPSSKRILKEGDIVSVDIGVEKNGYYGDGAFTFPVGKIDERTKRLMQVTLESLYLGIENAQESKRLQDISYAIQSHAEGYGYSVVRELVGHGIGKSPHEEPQVFNFGKPNRGPVLKEGMVLAIEPMINMGERYVETLEDGWTVITKDHMPSAHYEHTVVVRNGTPEILTSHNLKEEVL
ncbi:MAG: type I methionyl aminopeptidase [Calditrichaeota bacterium]|nr:type I methionyl aminopeptidase [Calditrichota bacterium]RQV92369.1 MAG: type I methionyl aminopeptidase [bacterium]RQV98713.1 MAG: type I methionyl aminopeptidase [Calditrichota bacterium]